jgi:hypothetical protein
MCAAVVDDMDFIARYQALRLAQVGRDLNPAFLGGLRSPADILLKTLSLSDR